MPSRSVIRNFADGEYYHVFNRGVEKRVIFLDDTDRKTFLFYLAVYTLPPYIVFDRYPKLPLRLKQKNLHEKVRLVSYSLMPNHFHLVLQQVSKGGVSQLLKQLTNAYTFYFNRKYNRVGSLVQGRFKALNIGTEEVLKHIIRYIHLNPVVAGIANSARDYEWSSHKEYISSQAVHMCDQTAKQFILSLFSSTAAFSAFIDDTIDYRNSLRSIEKLLIDEY